MSDKVNDDQDQDEDGDGDDIEISNCKVMRRGPSGRKMSLAMLRESFDLTQDDIATKVGIGQSAVSAAEARQDCLVSTLRRYVKAMGGELTLLVVIDGRKYPLELGVD